MRNFLRRFVNNLPWESGRQEGGYEKLLLCLSRRFQFDAYLIRYREGEYILRHRDPVDWGHTHHRLNIILKKPNEGGKGWIAESTHTRKWLNGRVVYFRPDITPHAVTPVIIGSRYVLSIGWLRKDK